MTRSHTKNLNITFIENNLEEVTNLFLRHEINRLVRFVWHGHITTMTIIWWWCKTNWGHLHMCNGHKTRVLCNFINANQLIIFLWMCVWETGRERAIARERERQTDRETEGGERKQDREKVRIHFFADSRTQHSLHSFYRNLFINKNNM